MELPDSIYTIVDLHSQRGNQFIDNEQFDAAIEEWSKALDVLPEPKTNWEAYMWLSASIGDAQYHKENYELARASFLNALNAPGGIKNPFVHYRLGQCQYKLGNKELGTDSLLRAYMLGGEDIFLAEDDGHFFLKILQDEHLTN